MNRYLVFLMSLLTPFVAQANMGKGAEGFFIMLLNNFLLAAFLIITLILAMTKFFKTKLKRNLFIALNILPLLITLYGLLAFLREDPELARGWLIIPAMLLGHVFALAIPFVQYKLLSQAPSHPDV